MQHRVRSVEVISAVPAASGLTPASVSRRWLLRALSSAAIGVTALVGLTNCGGGDDEEDEDDD